MTKRKLTWKAVWQILKNSFKGFSEDKLTKLAGALSYYTIFSLGPLLIVIIFVTSIFIEQARVEGTVYGQLEGFLGADSAKQLQEIIKNASLKGKSWLPAIIGIITLLIGATTVFAEIQDSINSIWSLKPKPKKGWIKMLQNRFLSFSVIVSLGFLLVVSLGITALVDAFSERLKVYFEGVTVVLFYIVNQVLTLIILTAIFAVIFKVLPDAKIKFKDVIAGAVTTALLFMLGKFGISLYVSKADVGSTYGAAGALVVLIVWTYYSSLILYFGAEITKNYAVQFGSTIHPNDYAVVTQQVEVEAGRKTIQENEKEKQQLKKDS
ncbi:MAG: YihY/virulence factor BrkB family protein [Chitinophagaceae bacterium]|nr:YihY/virulence factor BrkB family protein [Chitinophagaceae bacterium]